MQKEVISLKFAQNLMLASQKLNTDSRDTLGLIQHLGYVQLDTISVVERAHHHVLWTRNSNYQPCELNALMKKRKVYEYWSHAASVLPMSEYKFSLPTKNNFRSKGNSWFPRDKKMMNFVLKRIKAEGPLQSSDFKKDSKKSRTGWWDWKPTKKALERLFLDGDLEVSYRDSFRKVYDLPENVIPSHIDKSQPSEEEYYEYLIDRTLRHHGLASVAEMGYLCKKSERQSIQEAVDHLLEDNKLIQVHVKGLTEVYYAYSQSLEKKVKDTSRILILSPFDNFTIQRKKFESIFNFKYQIECYVPEAKRKFGYFCLPLFKGAKPLGRIDCKADRKEKTLYVKSLYSEDNSIDIQPMINSKLKSFAKFNGCDQISWFCIGTQFAYSHP